MTPTHLDHLKFRPSYILNWSKKGFVKKAEIHLTRSIFNWYLTNQTLKFNIFLESGIRWNAGRWNPQADSSIISFICFRISTFSTQSLEKICEREFSFLCFHISTESTILSLWWKIQVRENPYSAMFYLQFFVYIL